MEKSRERVNDRLSFGLRAEMGRKKEGAGLSIITFSKEYY